MCQGMSLNPSLLMFPVITSPFRKVPSPSGLCGWQYTRLCPHMRNLVGHAQRRRLIHVFVRLANIVMLPLTVIPGACRGCVSTAAHFSPQYLFFSLSSNCIKMINTLHLLVTFTQDKCCAVIARGRIIWNS